MNISIVGLLGEWGVTDTVPMKSTRHTQTMDLTYDTTRLNAKATLPKK